MVILTVLRNDEHDYFEDEQSASSGHAHERQSGSMGHAHAVQQFRSCVIRAYAIWLAESNQTKNKTLCLCRHDSGWHKLQYHAAASHDPHCEEVASAHWNESFLVPCSTSCIMLAFTVVSVAKKTVQAQADNDTGNPVLGGTLAKFL